MAKARKSYNDLEQEIQKLLAQQEALKDEQLEIFLKKFKTEKFKKKLLTIDPVVLKKVAETFIVLGSMLVHFSLNLCHFIFFTYPHL